MNADFQINGKQLETDRLILRPFKQSDLDDFYEYACVAGVGEMAGWIHHNNKEETHKILDSFIAGDKTFAIYHKEDQKVIGSLGVEKYGREDALTEFNGYYGRELGFVLSKAYWGKGIMPEAMHAVIEYLFGELNYDFLISSHYDCNNRSKKVQAKCGFKPYRKLSMNTYKHEKEAGISNLLINPKKKIKFVFSHPETLLYRQ